MVDEHKHARNEVRQTFLLTPRCRRPIPQGTKDATLTAYGLPPSKFDYNLTCCVFGMSLESTRTCSADYDKIILQSSFLNVIRSWSTMANYHQLPLPTMANYGLLQPTMTNYGQLWPTTRQPTIPPNYSQRWPTTTNYDQLWPTMTYYNQLWSTMVNYGQLQPTNPPPL